MQSQDAAAHDGSTPPTTNTACGSSTPSKRPRESAPTDVGDCETESQLRKRRMVPDEAPHERMERPNFDEDADSEDDEPQLKFHQQNIVDEAFATFLAKHNIDAPGSSAPRSGQQSRKQLIKAQQLSLGRSW